MTRAVIFRSAALALLLVQARPAGAIPAKHLAAKPSLAQQGAAADPDKTLAAMREFSRMDFDVVARTPEQLRQRLVEGHPFDREIVLRACHALRVVLRR